MCALLVERIEGRRWEEALRIAKQLPYVELHLHLDGSLTPEFIAKRAAARGVRDAPPASRVRSYVHFMKQKEGLPAARAWCAQFLQTAEELQEACRCCAAAAVSTGCAHLELRLCPHAHTREGLTPHGVVAAAVAGFAAGAAGLLRGGLVLSVRAAGAEACGHEAVLLAAQFAQRGVLGVELAAEAAPPEARSLTPWRAVARSAAAADVPLTVHISDEGLPPLGGPGAPLPGAALQNAALALQLGAARLSGAHALLRDAPLLRAAASAGVAVEVCVTHTVRPGQPGWPGAYADHPVRALFAAGTTVAPCVGHALLAGEAGWPAEPAAELAHLVLHCGFTWADVRAMLLAAARAAFLPAEDADDDTDAAPAARGAYRAPAERRERFAERFGKQLDAALAAAGAYAPGGLGSPVPAVLTEGAEGGGAARSANAWDSGGEGAPALLGGALLPRSRAAQRAREAPAAAARPASPPAAVGRAQVAPLAQRAPPRFAASMPAPRSGEEPDEPSLAVAAAARAAPPAAQPWHTATPAAAAPPPPPMPLPVAAALPAPFTPPVVPPLRLPPLEEALATMGLGSGSPLSFDSDAAVAIAAAAAAAAAAEAWASPLSSATAAEAEASPPEPLWQPALEAMQPRSTPIVPTLPLQSLHMPSAAAALPPPPPPVLVPATGSAAVPIPLFGDRSAVAIAAARAAGAAAAAPAPRALPPDGAMRSTPMYLPRKPKGTDPASPKAEGAAALAAAPAPPPYAPPRSVPAPPSPSPHPLPGQSVARRTVAAGAEAAAMLESVKAAAAVMKSSGLASARRTGLPQPSPSAAAAAAAAAIANAEYALAASPEPPQLGLSDGFSPQQRGSVADIMAKCARPSRAVNPNAAATAAEALAAAKAAAGLFPASVAAAAGAAHSTRRPELRTASVDDPEGIGRVAAPSLELPAAEYIGATMSDIASYFFDAE